MMAGAMCSGARLQNLAFDLRTILGELSSEPSLREKARQNCSARIEQPV
jgi:hypothetical protein